MKKKQTQSLKTPELVKTFFADFIFPCKANKTPATLGNWQDWEGNIDLIKLAGLDLKKADLLVIDFDFYKPEWNAESQKFYERVKKINQFVVKTQSGGEHYYFRQPENPEQKITNKFPLEGVEFKGVGGYVCLYNLPFYEKAGIENFDALKKLLPELPKEILKGLKLKKKSSIGGPGRTNDLLNSGFGVFANQKADAIVDKVFEIAKEYKKNPSKTTQPQAMQKLKKSLSDGLKQQSQKIINNYLKDKSLIDSLEKPSKKPDLKGQKTAQKKCSISFEIIKPEIIKTISFLGLPSGSLSVLGGGQGEGKTTTALKAGAENSQNGDQRPMLIFTRENSINNLVLPWWSQFGGVKGKLAYPTHKDFPKPEMLSYEIIKKQLLESISTGEFAIVFIDLVYLMVKNELENKEYEKAFLEFQNNLHHTTAALFTAHLKKSVKDQPLLHHFRGGTDLTGIPDRIMYLRRGKDPSQRIIVKLKDRPTGELDGGIKTSMQNKKADITWETIAGNPKQILAENAEKLAIEEDQKEDKIEDYQVGIVERQVASYPPGTWLVKNYQEWAKDKLDIGRDKARSFLKKAGYKVSKAKDGSWKVF